MLDGLLRHEHPLGEESTAARLRLGPDCDEGLNVGRVSDADWAAALGPEAARAFSLPGLLESIERVHVDTVLCQDDAGADLDLESMSVGQEGEQ